MTSGNLTVPGTSGVAPSTQEISTGDWDVVHAMHFDELNRAIVAAHSSPATFHYEMPDPHGQVTFDGTFDDWQVTGGSGSILFLTVPIPSGSWTQGGVVHPFSAASADIQVDMAWVPPSGVTETSPTSRITNAAGSNQLQVAATTAPGDPPASVKTVTSAHESGAIKLLLAKWLNENLAEFGHVFAAVDVAAEIATAEHLAWLMPKVVSYAVAAPVLDDNGNAVQPPVFAVLAMTQSSDPPGVPQFASPSAIPDGATSALLISRDLFISQVLLSTAPALFMGATPGDFEVMDDRATVSNKKHLGIQSWELEDGTVVDPSIDPGTFSLAVEGDGLRLAFDDVAFAYGSSGTCHVWCNTKATVGLGADGHLALTPSGMQFGGYFVKDPQFELDMILTSIGITIFTMAVGAVAQGISAAGEAGEAAEAGEVSETADGATVAPVSVVVDDADAIGTAEEGVSSLETSENEVTASTSGEASTTTKSAGWFARNSMKIRAGVIAIATAAPSILISHIPDMLAAQAQGQMDKIPGLEDLVDHVVSPVTWTGVGARTVTGAQLNGALVIGLKPATGAAATGGTGSSTGEATS
jgi:hypothetical protein